MMTDKEIFKNKMLSGIFLLLATLAIFLIATVIEHWLKSYDLSSMYISFCSGFILFTPLVSLTLHPLLFKSVEDKLHKKSALIVNVGLVLIVQSLFFLIWITDAVAIYSIYVDSNSFLAKAFNITSNKSGNFSQEFYWVNLLLAWLFAYLSVVVGLLPCLIARLKNLGVVGNFVSAFQFAKTNKLSIAIYSFSLAISAVMPLMYSRYLFIVIFPLVLVWIFINIANDYLAHHPLKRSI